MLKWRQLALEVSGIEGTIVQNGKPTITVPEEVLEE